MDGQQLSDTITLSILIICGAAVAIVFIWKELG